MLDVGSAPTLVTGRERRTTSSTPEQKTFRRTQKDTISGSPALNYLRNSGRIQVICFSMLGVLIKIIKASMQPRGKICGKQSANCEISLMSAKETFSTVVPLNIFIY